MLITSDNDNCSTQGMLRNRVSCVRSIVIVKVNIIITSPQLVFHKFIVMHKVQYHRATRCEFFSSSLVSLPFLFVYFRNISK